MKKLTITWVGQPKDVQTKFGTKQKHSIKATEYGDNYLSTWTTPTTRNWKVGDVVEVEDVTNRDYNGKTYYDIQMPKTAGGVSSPKLDEILRQVSALGFALGKIKLDISSVVEHLAGTKRLDTTSDGKPMPNFEPKKPVSTVRTDEMNPEDFNF